MLENLMERRKITHFLVKLLVGVLIELRVDDKKCQLAGNGLDEVDLVAGKIARADRLNSQDALELIGTKMKALGAEQHDRHSQHREKRLLAQPWLNPKARLAPHI